MSVSSGKIIEVIKQKVMCEICRSRVATRSRRGFGKKRVRVCGRCYEMVKF
jgi:hypothetical protein